MVRPMMHRRAGPCMMGGKKAAAGVAGYWAGLARYNDEVWKLH